MVYSRGTQAAITNTLGTTRVEFSLEQRGGESSPCASGPERVTCLKGFVGCRDLPRFTGVPVSAGICRSEGLSIMNPILDISGESSQVHVKGVREGSLQLREMRHRVDRKVKKDPFKNTPHR